MKILQFMASEKWGGAEKVFVDLSNALSDKHQVMVLLLRNTEYKKWFSKNVTIIELASHPTTHNPFLLWEIYSVLKQSDPDIIHTHAVKASALVRRVNRFLGNNHLATKHNARKGNVFNHLKWVTAVSKQGCCSIKSKRKDAVKRLIHNGILPKEIDGEPDGEIFHMAAIGRLDAIKGFDVLVEQVQKLSFDFRLEIVGDGREFENLKNKIETLGLKQRIHLTGFREDIPKVMKEAHLIVISSFSEGFPQVMVEALFYAHVLVSTPVGGVKEVLPPIFLAEQCELAEKIEDIYTRYDSYKSRFRQLKHQKAEYFHLDKITREYESFYEEIKKSGSRF